MTYVKTPSNFRDLFKSLSTLYATSLIKIEAGLDNHDFYLSKLVSNLGMNSAAVTGSGFISVWEAIKERRELVGVTKVSVEVANASEDNFRSERRDKKQSRVEDTQVDDNKFFRVIIHVMLNSIYNTFNKQV